MFYIKVTVGTRLVASQQNRTPFLMLSFSPRRRQVGSLSAKQTSLFDSCVDSVWGAGHFVQLHKDGLGERCVHLIPRNFAKAEKQASQGCSFLIEETVAMMRQTEKSRTVAMEGSCETKPAALGLMLHGRDEEPDVVGLSSAPVSMTNSQLAVVQQQLKDPRFPIPAVEILKHTIWSSLAMAVRPWAAEGGGTSSCEGI